MQFIKLKTALVLLFLSVFSLAAEEAITLDIRSSVNAALEQNKNYLITGLQTESAKKGYDSRWNSLIPAINFSSGLDYRDSAVSAWTNPDSTRRETPLSFSAGLSFSLPLNTGLAHKMEQTRLDYEASLISFETAEKQLIRDVEKEFYYLLTIHANLEVLEKNRELARKRFEQTRTNFNNGFASELQVLQAEVSASSYIPQLSQARKDYDTRLRRFLILLGMDPEQNVKITGELETPAVEFDTEFLLRTYIASRQDIQGQQKQIESLENQKKTSTSSGFSPNLTVSGGWSTGISDPFNSGSWQSDTWTDTASVGINLRIPLDGYIPGSSQRINVIKTQDKIDQAELQMEALTDGARSEILNLNQTINASLEQLDQAVLNKALAEKSYALTEESYKLGTTERLDVEDAQQSYLEAIQQELSSTYQYMAGLIDLKYALNLDSLNELYRLSINEQIKEKNNG